MTRTVYAKDITQLVEKLCIEANCHLTEDIYQCLGECRKKEKSPLGKDILNTLIENADIARTGNDPICQDTGMTVVFVTMGGQDVHIEGGAILKTPSIREYGKVMKKVTSGNP